MMSIIKDVLRPVVGQLPDRIRTFRRQKDLEAKRRHISKAVLTEQLKGLPIPGGAVILVHSSLKSLGYVEGGAAAVVEALIDAFVDNDGGTVLLPTYTIGGSMHQSLLSGRIFDVTSTPSNLGAIPEAFRRHPLARRSVHPTHSFAAIGPRADWLVAGHHRCETSFGHGSPMARLLDAEGCLLGLGTTLGSVTFYHCLEDMEADFPLDVYSADSPVAVTCRDHDGAPHRLSINAHDATISGTRIDRPSSEPLRRFYAKRFERHAGLVWHQVGEARVWQVGAKPLYDEMKRLMDRGMTIYSTAPDLLAFERRYPSGTTTTEDSRRRGSSY